MSQKRIHANDGISPAGRAALEEAGFTVTTEAVPQDQLAAYLNKEHVEVLLVRSATQVRRDLIDSCPGLRMIGRGGVGMDNIDVEYGRGKGIHVFNTPASSSISVAELVMGHLFSLMRGLHEANRRMPAEGASAFKVLKKAYGKGRELRGKTLGIIGFGRIGRWTARYALGCGMRVIYVDNTATTDSIEMEIGGQTVRVPVKMVAMDELLASADAVSLHVPAQADGRPILGRDELARMKPGAVLVNTARGGSVDEDALLAALREGRLAGAALDVFVNEPTPRADLLSVAGCSLSPHIGAATVEAQDRIGEEIAEIVIAHYTEADVDA